MSLFDTTEERQRRTEALTRFGFDGPKTLGADIFPAEGAICLTCGALILLGDGEEIGGVQIERGIRLHSAWHNPTTKGAGA